MSVTTAVFDLQGNLVKQNPTKKNLILDCGLNGLAKDTSLGLSTFAANSFLYCQVGDGTTPVKISSGAITFTQSGNVVTASGNFFTAPMQGAILKYGSGMGGDEQYITAVNSGTEAIVSTSATVGATVGSVWLVNQTGLDNPLFATNSYVTGSAFCDTTFAGDVVTMKRTFNFPVQNTTYNVNEIGWCPNSNLTYSMGRFVLPSTDVVSPANYYVVTLELTINLAPAAPVAQTNVGTNIDVSGSFAVEYNGFAYVQTNGQTSNAESPFDRQGQTYFVTSAWTQNTSISNSVNPVVSTLPGTVSAQPVFQNSVGLSALQTNFSLTTNGQTCYGISQGNTLGGSLNFYSDEFTTPATLPVGPFVGSIIFSQLWTRNLTN